MATPDTVTPAPKSHKSLPRTTLSYIHLKALRTVPGSGIPGPGNGPVTRRRGTRAGTEGRTGAARTSAGRPTPDSEPDGEGAPPAPTGPAGPRRRRRPRAPRPARAQAGSQGARHARRPHLQLLLLLPPSRDFRQWGGRIRKWVLPSSRGRRRKEGEHNALSKSVPLSRNAIVYLR